MTRLRKWGLNTFDADRRPGALRRTTNTPSYASEKICTRSLKTGLTEEERSTASMQRSEPGKTISKHSLGIIILNICEMEQ